MGGAVAQAADRGAADRAARARFARRRASVVASQRLQGAEAAGGRGAAAEAVWRGSRRTGVDDDSAREALAAGAGAVAGGGASKRTLRRAVTAVERARRTLLEGPSAAPASLGVAGRLREAEEASAPISAGTLAAQELIHSLAHTGANTRRLRQDLGRARLRSRELQQASADTPGVGAAPDRGIDGVVEAELSLARAAREATPGKENSPPASWGKTSGTGVLCAPGAPYQSIGSPLDREALTQICRPGARGEAILGYLDQQKSDEDRAAGRTPQLRRAPQLRKLEPEGGSNTPTKGSPGSGGDSYSPSCYYRSKKSQGRKGKAVSPQGASGSWGSPKAHALSPSAFSTVSAPSPTGSSPGLRSLSGLNSPASDPGAWGGSPQTPASVESFRSVPERGEPRRASRLAPTTPDQYTPPWSAPAGAGKKGRWKSFAMDELLQSERRRAVAKSSRLPKQGARAASASPETQAREDMLQQMDHALFWQGQAMTRALSPGPASGERRRSGSAAPPPSAVKWRASRLDHYPSAPVA